MTNRGIISIQEGKIEGIGKLRNDRRGNISEEKRLSKFCKLLSSS